MKCPNCGSGNVNKSSALYEQQLTRYDGASTGWWITSRGTVGVRQSRSRGNRTSVVIERNAPPTGVSEAVGCAAMLPLIAVPVLILIGVPLWLSILLPPAAGIGLAIWVHGKTKDEAAPHIEAYSRQWYCSKCGSIFHDRPHKSEGEGYEPHLRPAIQAVARSGTDRQAYIDRVISPIQRARTPTDRDDQGLFEIVNRSTEDHSFEPTAMDKGLVSRLASLSFIAYDPARDRFFVTAVGMAHARGG